jgi:hypothetical protein
MDVNDIFHVKLGMIIRLFEKLRTLFPFCVAVVIALSIGVATYPLPLLSFHPVSEFVGPTYVVVSAASSHRVHPGIVGAPRPEFDVETICAPVGKKTEGWLVSVFEMIGGGTADEGAANTPVYMFFVELTLAPAITTFVPSELDATENQLAVPLAGGRPFVC